MSEHEIRNQMRRLEESIAALADRVSRMPVRWGTSGIAAGVVVRAFRVKSVGPDHLVCRTFNHGTSSEGTVDIDVAKSPELRRFLFDTLTINGLTYTYISNTERSVTDGTVTELQKIKPDYIDPGSPVVRQLIFAITPVTGQTGVTTAQEVIWQDLDVDSRKWVVVC